MASPRATAVASIGPVAVGSVLWRRSGQLQLTAIVKARLAFVHGGSMKVLGPPPLVERDVHEGDDPTHSLREASDLVPFRPRADVWLRGHAAFPGGAASIGIARLALYRGRSVVIDKTVHVVGDRVGGSEPRPFERMPLVYERAYGGVGFDDNPVGVGVSDGVLPNVLDPREPTAAIGFGPISGYWKLRRACLGSHSRRELEREQVEVFDDLDPSYFQAAPLDQRVDPLRGDEWVVLDGMDSQHLRIQSRLPKVEAAARVMVGDQAVSVPLEADTLAIDADAKICCLVWRGSVLVAPQELDELVVVGSLLTAGQSEDDVPWARAAETKLAPVRARHSSPRLDQSGVTTVTEPENDFGQTIVERPDARSRPYGDIPDELTETGALPRIPLAVDTEPGRPPPFDDELPWIDEPGTEPEPITQRTPRQHQAHDEPAASEARLSSLPPAPLDLEAYARALREAGASEDDIAALLRLLTQE